MSLVLQGLWQMRGEGTSMGHSRPRTCSGRKTLKRCKNKEEADNVVLIDVDSDSNVIIIDVPEYLPKKLRGRSSVPRKDKNCPLRNIICIDDDEITDNDDGGIDVNGDGNFCGPSNHCENSVDAVDGDSVQENISPLKLSKCKRTYSGKASSRNRYGLSTDSEGGSSDNDGPDCEFMEDSGIIREQWEKASLKRKNGVLNGQSGIGHQASASRFFTDTHQDVGAENKTERDRQASASSASSKDDNERHAEASVSSSSSKGSYEKEDQSPSMATGNGNLRSASLNTKKAPFTDTDLKSTHKTQFHHSEADVQAREELFTEDPSSNYAEWKTHKCSKHGDSSFQNEGGYSPQGPPLSSSNEQGTKQVNLDKKKTPQGEPSLSVSDSIGDINSLYNGQHSVETNKKVGAVPVQSLFCKSSSLGKSEIRIEKGCHKGEGELDTEEHSLCDLHLNVSQLKQGLSCTVEETDVPIESMSNGQQEDGKDNLLHAEDGDDELAVQSSLINERENLKETDEYKRAVEEEWASRQRELQIQAEAAQQLRRLRKRRKAESMRLLDMERRQKQRVEEIRETQKKDEENMNLKEQLRAEVRKELNKLELMCCDMASLLRGLGIHVNGGLHPSSHEVRGAYKRALLNFHPDRASQSDLRQQVEAEEKFKLISRMKEKFLPTS